MKLYWFRNLVYYFPTWNRTRHIFWRHWRMTSKVRKRTSRDTKNENKRGKLTLVWPHDVESFQGSTFCLFVMVQPWKIGVCWIDQVFVTELTVVIFFCSCSRFEYKNSIGTFSKEYIRNEYIYIYIYIMDLVCYTYFHWFFNPECQHIFGKQTGYIFQSPKKFPHMASSYQPPSWII
jgi:hypothetical protein